MESNSIINVDVHICSFVLSRHVQYHQHAWESRKVLHLQDCLQTRGGHHRHIQLLRGRHSMLASVFALLSLFATLVLTV